MSCINAHTTNLSDRLPQLLDHLLKHFPAVPGDLLLTGALAVMMLTMQPTVHLAADCS